MGYILEVLEWYLLVGYSHLQVLSSLGLGTLQLKLEFKVDILDIDFGFLLVRFLYSGKFG